MLFTLLTGIENTFSWLLPSIKHFLTIEAPFFFVPGIDGRRHQADNG